ncbi:MAG: insulinase family protein [Rikenellaceae bacterium]|nr:insulinase family protein [Rikenellaceae bacterium]MBQ6861759.1 insulinase family protein [Alistipes sp.]
MKKILTLMMVVAAMLFAACGSKYAYESVKGDPTQTRIYTLDNGLKVYMSVSKEEPRIQTYIAVRVGGKNDPSETTGLAHYFEHLMFKGTEQFGTQDYAAEKPMLDEIEQLFEVYRKTEDEAERKAIYKRIDSISYEASKLAIPNEYDKLMATIGAQGTNAYTGYDMTVYVENIPSNQVENWLKIEADRFKNVVIRGFHTELETIYEEKNMSLTQDGRKVYEAMNRALFPNHPYGKQTVLGTQEHLKNPSITNVKNYHDQYYVPNNMAICLSGDFDPEQMISLIDQYFGDMQPNPEIPVLEFEPEQPITEPIVEEVWGLDAANVAIGWRLGGAASEDADLANIVGSILYNGQAGLIDLDINQQQKTLSAYGYPSLSADYGYMQLAGRPKQGQSLEEVRDLLLGEVAKLRAGEFDEALIAAAVNNYKLEAMQYLDSNDGRADMYVQSFINRTEWKDEVEVFDRLSKITKEDVVRFANEKLGEQNYAIIYKRQGKDPNEQKIAKPEITPIVTNRDAQSDFFKAVAASEVKPIEPRFVDFEKDMDRFEAQSGIEVLYKQNTTTDYFSLEYMFDLGTLNDPALGLAFDYTEYLGTLAKSAEQIQSELYGLACGFNLRASTSRCRITISGLGENMNKAMDVVEDLVANAVADEAILANVKQDMLKSRANAKLNQSSNFSALQSYVIYGEEGMNARLSNEELMALTSEELLAKVRDLLTKQHTVVYYGPATKDELLASLNEHHNVPEELQPLEIKRLANVPTPENKVFIAEYDANQIYYIQYSNRGEKFDVANDANLDLYNEYFGGGMSSIVFQEMREARGLAYSARAYMSTPTYADGTYSYTAYIATQNDKMKQAIEAFDEIINTMPESEAAFNVAKESYINQVRTLRYTKASVLYAFINARDMGLDYDRARDVFEKVQTMTLDDVKAVQQQWVKDRNYYYLILGDSKNLDLNYLRTLGPITFLSQEQIFGY